MKKTNLKIWLMASLMCVISCQQNQAESTLVSSSSTTISDANAKGGNKCLLDFSEDYTKLLTKDMAAEITGFPADRAISGSYTSGTASKDYDNVMYEWENGREKYISQIDRMAKTRDFVKVTGVKAMSLKEFQMSYRAVSDKDMEILHDKIDEKPKKKEAVLSPEQQKKLKDLGLSEEEQKQMMKDFSGMAQKVTKAYSSVENLGDAAVWNTLENTLYVLTDGVKFHVNVEVGIDEEKNKSTAIRAAKMILDRCK